MEARVQAARQRSNARIVFDRQVQMFLRNKDFQEEVADIVVGMLEVHLYWQDWLETPSILWESIRQPDCYNPGVSVSQIAYYWVALYNVLPKLADEVPHFTQNETDLGSSRSLYMKAKKYTLALATVSRQMREAYIDDMLERDSLPHRD